MRFRSSLAQLYEINLGTVLSCLAYQQQSDTWSRVRATFEWMAGAKGETDVLVLR